MEDSCGSMEICKEKARVRFSVADFFFTVETLPIIVKYFNFKSLENGSDRL